MRLRFFLSALFFITTAQPALAEGLLWLATAENGGRAYILGSIHVGTADLYPLPEAVTRAFNGSEKLVVELDVEALPPQTMGQYIYRHGFLTGGRTLADTLSPETLALWRENPRHPSTNNLKPWLAALTLQLYVVNEHGYDEQYGLDRHFLKQAKARGLKIVELETLEEQMSPLIQMTDSQADLFLKATLMELAKLPEIIGGLIKAWAAGDDQGFARIFFSEYEAWPELRPVMDKVVYGRNKTMADRLHRLMNEKETLFVVIGAAHLVGPESLLSELSAKGYQINVPAQPGLKEGEL